MLQLLSNRPSIKPQVFDFLPADTQELFEQNLKIQPQSWPWRTRKVAYTLNSQGFRCGEFDSLDWNRSILAFGCSMTMGIGVDDQDVWTEKLSRFIQCPVINLGQGGQGWGFNWVNSNRVVAAGYRPRAVVYYWTTEERMFTFPEQRNLNLVDGRGSWDLDPGRALAYPGPARDDQELAKKWLLHPHMSTFWADQYMQSLNCMWSLLHIPVYHYTWVEKVHVRTGIPLIPIYYDHKNKMTRARDFVHPGPTDHVRIALRMYTDLQWVTSATDRD